MKEIIVKWRNKGEVKWNHYDDIFKNEKEAEKFIQDEIRVGAGNCQFHIVERTITVIKKVNFDMR